MSETTAKAIRVITLPPIIALFSDYSFERLLP